MTDRIYTLWDSNTKIVSEHGTDYVVGKVKEGVNIEVRHSLLDSTIASKQLEEKIRNRTKKEVRYWDISKIRLTQLYKPNFVLKAFRGTQLLKSIHEKYTEKKRSEKSWIDIVKEILLPVISISTFVWSAFDLNASISVNTTSVLLRPAILLVVAVIFFFIWCVYKYKRRNEKREYYVSAIEESLKNLPKEEVDKVIPLLKPHKCNLNKHCINLIENAYNLPNIIQQILCSFISFQASEQGRLQSKNMANVIFSLQNTESPFYKCDTPVCRLTLKQLTYVEKLNFLEYSYKEQKKQPSEFQKIILKHLGIDVINDVYSIRDLEKIRKNLSVCKDFEEQLDFMEKETNENRDIILILLYFYTYLTNINGRIFTKRELINLIKSEEDNNEKPIAIIKTKLSIPTDSEIIDKLVARVFKYFNGICDSDYRFKDYLGAILYLCANNLIDDNITEITKLCIFKIPKIKLQDEDVYNFTLKACNFLMDKPNVANYDFYRLLLAETEQRGIIDLHCAIFDVINTHMETEEELKEKIAKSPNIIDSAFISLVHSPYEESMLQHIKFINACAIAPENKLAECPVFMDVFILDEKMRNQYYADLMLIDKRTLRFIEYLYALYCVSLKNSNIIDDRYFYINKSLIDIDKASLISDIKNLCKFEQFKNSIFDDFIGNIQKIILREEDYELSDYSRKLYSFLIKLYYYANSSILEENFAKFIDLIITSNDLGMTTRCELMAQFGFFRNYQKRRIFEFLTCNSDKLAEIMKTRVQEERFSIELAYKSIPNIQYINYYINENDERINLNDNFVKLIRERFPTEFVRFKEDSVILLYGKTNDSIDIKNLAHRMSLIDQSLVISILYAYHTVNEEVTLYIVREYFELLKNGTSDCNRYMLFYLNSDRIEVNQSDIDILQYLIEEEIYSKSHLFELQKALIKWRSLLGDSYKQAYINTIEQMYKLHELKLKTDAKEENNEEYLEEDLEILRTERDNEIEAFLLNEEEEEDK